MRVEDVDTEALDDLVDDLAELDAIAYVGDTAFQRLTAYAAAHPAPAAESEERPPKAAGRG